MGCMLEEKIFLVIIAALVLFFCLYVYNENFSTNYKRSHDTQLRMAVVETVGGPCMPIIAQCCTSRNLSEGIYARRSDIPGGYCFHSDCDIVYTKKLFKEQYYTISSLKNEK